MSTAIPPGPLTAAAAEFERELSRYERIGAELARTTVRSQKTLARTQKLLTESSECEQELGVRLRSLLEAMNGTRDRQQACMEQTLAAAQALKQRAERFSALIERVSALGNRARETSEPAIKALEDSMGGASGESLVQSLEQLGDRMIGIIREADEIAHDSERDDWPDITRDVQSLRQQVNAAHGRVVQALQTVGARIIS